MQRRLKIGVLALAIALGAARGPKLAENARAFGRQFHELKSANIGPIERVVLSLAMTS
jgi:hypothetical protein